QAWCGALRAEFRGLWARNTLASGRSCARISARRQRVTVLLPSATQENRRKERRLVAAKKATLCSSKVAWSEQTCTRICANLLGWTRESAVYLGSRPETHSFCWQRC